MTAGAAPGWYPDPSGRFEFRWFNGATWTADVSVHGQRYVDPGATAPPHRQGTVYPAAAHPPGRGRAAAALIVGGLSLLVAWIPFVFVIGVGGAVVAIGLGVSALRRMDRGTDGRPMAGWGIGLAVAALAVAVVGGVLTAHLWRAIADALDVGDYRTEITSCTADRRLVGAMGTITNLDDREHDYRITVEFTQKGAMVALAEAEVTAVGPQQAAHFEVSAFTDVAADTSCSVFQVQTPYAAFSGDTGAAARPQPADVAATHASYMRE